MRVHRLTVKDVKGVRERTVVFPDHGVVVVEGPNEVGKSTILEAFDKLLDPRLKSTSTREEVRSLKPVGRDVGPYVEAEFTVGGHRVRYAKRWLRQPLTTLEVLSPVPAQLSGEAAQARVDQLIAQSLDRTLWDALRFAQSQDGTVAPLADSAVLSSALDAAAGSQLHAEEGELILDRVAKEFSLYFTRTGRPTGDYKAALAAYHLDQDAVSEAHRRLQEAEQLLGRQEQVRREVTQAAEGLARAHGELTAAHEAREVVSEIVTAHERVRARLGEASEKSRAAARIRRERRELVAELATITARVSRAETQLVTDQKAAGALIEPLAAAEETATATEDALERAEEVAEAARADADHLVDLARLHELESLTDRVRDLVPRLAATREKLCERPITAQTVQQIQGLGKRAMLLQARHEGASGRVCVESLGASVSVTTSESNPEGPCLESGERQTFVVTEQTVITVDGAVRVVVVPEESGKARAAELATARLDLDRALVEHGVQTIEELEQAVAEQQRVQQEVRELAHVLEVTTASRSAAEQRQALAGVVPSGLIDDMSALRTRLDAFATARVSEVALPDDEASANEAARGAARSLLQARSARRTATTTVKECRARAQLLRTELERATGRLESDRDRLTQLSEALHGARLQVADEALEIQVRERSMVLAAVELEAERAARALEAADVEGMTRRTLEAAVRVDVADAEHVRLTAALHTLNGQIEMAASEGRSELYDHAVATLDETERHLSSLDRRARAARHLWRTLQAHRDAAHRAYVLPYTQTLERLGRVVYGASFAVTVDDQLTLAARTLDGTTVPFEQLSGGAKEQLGILARLAVAQLVDPAQGVPVVIDDALGYSDPGRLQQMGEILGASAQGADVQVILLTCTPERYAAIPHTTTIRLSA
ncbi:MAG: AAA family ATPase [Ornithinimicrobium sp.]|uniref:AAA family ATPase n=1 Tax=Ornithinimicrobium sp. TaxID=1977084 RepID=UPI0026DF9FC4|nr:AAA family ATPase [Ornithinimicrobium sp.]MDO5740987.1 AAA family ATPase [Ornithinimicrobium sp.]